MSEKHNITLDERWCQLQKEYWFAGFKISHTELHINNRKMCGTWWSHNSIHYFPSVFFSVVLYELSSPSSPHLHQHPPTTTKIHPSYRQVFWGLFNPTALRRAKTLWSFGNSECIRVKKRNHPFYSRITKYWFKYIRSFKKEKTPRLIAKYGKVLLK